MHISSHQRRYSDGDDDRPERSPTKRSDSPIAGGEFGSMRRQITAMWWTSTDPIARVRAAGVRSQSSRR
jgi:hypothetical protein